jgi:outer membrane protein assembly factor BamB
VAGVRGTEFRTSVDDTGVATVSVREGAVDVRPAVPEVDDFEVVDDVQRRVASRLRAAFDSAAVRVSADQELSVTEEEAQRAADVLLPDRMKVVETLRTANEDEAGQIAETAETTAPEAAQALPETTELSEEERQALTRIAELHPVSLIRDAAAAPEAEYVSLEIVASPESAAIFLNGQRAGQGRVSALYERGRKVAVRVAAENYQTLSFPITLRDTQGRSLSVQLQRVPEASLRIQTEPVDADIVIAGEVVGAGSVERSYPVGTALEITAVHPNYTAETQTVELDSPGERELTVSMTERAEDVSEEATEAATAVVTVLPRPRDATVTMNGREVDASAGAAEGERTREFEVGSQVAVQVEAPGYIATTKRVLVQDSGNRHTIELERRVVTREVFVNTVPSSAEIFLNGRSVGVGSYSGEHEVGDRLRFSAQAEGYLPNSLMVTVSQDLPARFRIELEQRAVEREISIRTTPADAVVRLEGGTPRRGGGTYRLSAGSEYQLVAERPGFAPLTTTLSVSEESPAEYVFELDPQPLLWEQRVSSAPIVRCLVHEDGTLYWAGADGRVGAVNTQGSVQWRSDTRNAPNENAMPVAAGDRVYFSGATEFVVLRSDTGAVVERSELPGNRAHVFGRSITPIPGGYAYPSNASLDLVIDGDAAGSVSISEGSTMSAAYRDGVLYIADNRGTFLVIDVDSAAITEEIPTEAVQPVAHAPVLWKDHAYFSGRRGTLVAVNIDTGSVDWTYDLGNGVFSCPVATEAGVFVFADDRVIGLSHDGAELFPPQGGAAGSPAVQDGELAYPTVDGVLRILDVATGAELASYTLPSPSQARPAYLGDRIYVATADGRVIALHRAGMGR